MIARKLISLLRSSAKSSACVSRISAPDAQLEEGNHEHTYQRCICTQPGNEEFRSIGSARHTLTWAQTHPCASRMDSSGHPDRGALSCQAPGILYFPSNHLHRRYVRYLATHPWLCTSHPEAWPLRQQLCHFHPRAYYSLGIRLLRRQCSDFLAPIR